VTAMLVATPAKSAAMVHSRFCRGVFTRFNLRFSAGAWPLAWLKRFGLWLRCVAGGWPFDVPGRSLNTPISSGYAGAPKSCGWLSRFARSGCDRWLMLPARGSQACRTAACASSIHFDQWLAEGIVHDFNQSPRAHVGHAQAPRAAGNRTLDLDGGQEVRFAGTEGDYSQVKNPGRNCTAGAEPEVLGLDCR